MKKILVPTDFSKCALNAVHFAFELALAHKAEILLYHSITPMYAVDTNFYAVNYMAEYYDFKKLELQKMLQKIYATNPTYKAIKTKTTYDFGTTTDNIIDAAKANHADLIVMGTKGTSGIQEFVFGSTAGWVVAKSSTPVLVIPEGVKYSKNQSPFLFATDFSTLPDAASIKVLNDLCSHQKATVKLVHVADGTLNAVADNTIKTVQKKLNKINSEVELITANDISPAIDKYAKKIKAGLCIMVSHHYNMFERLLFSSVTKQATFHTKLPLLILIKENK